MGAHEKYLSDLMRRRESSLDYIRQGIRGGMSFLGEQSDILSKKTESLARRKDLTPAALSNLLTQQNREFLNIAGKTEIAGEERLETARGKYQSEISKVEHQINLEKEQEKAQEKATKGKIISAAGMLAGGIASAATGGVAGVIAGSAIPAITNLAIGLDKSYDPVMRSQMINQTVEETLGGISALATLKTENKFTTDYAEAYQLGEGLEGDARIRFLEDFQNYLNAGQLPQFVETHQRPTANLEYMNNYHKPPQNQVLDSEYILNSSW